MEERVKRLKKGQGEPEFHSVFWIQQEDYTQELTAAMEAYTRPAQVQTSQHASLVRRDAHKPTPGWEQLTVDRVPFTLRVWPWWVALTPVNGLIAMHL